MPKPRVRCQVCRMWLDVPRGAVNAPTHRYPFTEEECPGSNKPAAQRRGMG